MKNDENGDLSDGEKQEISDNIGRIHGAGQLAKLKIYQEYITRISNNEQLKLAEKKHFDELDQQFGAVIDGDRIKEHFTRDEVIEKLGISDRSLKWHTTRQNLVRNKDGTYPLKTLNDFERKYKRKPKPGEKVNDLSSQQEQADLRYRIARARWQELNVKQLSGKLMSQDEVFAEWSKRLAVLFSGIQLWSSRLPPRFEGKSRDEMMRILVDEIYLLRKTFVKKGRYCPEVDGAIGINDA
jgi:hypothetical protein